MNRLFGTVSLLLLLVGLPSVGVAPSSAATTQTPAQYGSLQVDNGVSYACGPRYRYQLTLPAEFQYSVDMDFRAYGPDGLEATWDYDFDAPLRGSGTMDICNDVLEGRYRAVFSVEACDYDYNCLKFDLTDQFKMRHPKTKTSLKVTPIRPNKGGVVTFRVLTRDERPTGFFPTLYADIALQQRRSGRWVRVRHSSVETDHGRVTLRYRWNGGTALVRAITPRTSYLRGSTSKPVRVGR